MRISIIAAVATNGVIGREGRLPWHLSTDLKRFKQLTMGHAIIMGRRTWESIGRPLPGRRTIVVTRQSEYSVPEGVQVAASLDDALDAAQAAGECDAFVVGGAELYHEALGLADRLYFTEVAADVEGDTYFPVNFDTFEWESWVTTETEAHAADAENDYAFVFVTLERTDPTAMAE
nr:Dihydrofolate reductase [uncultured bacterium]